MGRDGVIQCDQVTTRVQFGNKLETYGVVQEKLARMAIQLYVTEVSRACFGIKGWMSQHKHHPLPAVHGIHAQWQHGQRSERIPT